MTLQAKDVLAALWEHEGRNQVMSGFLKVEVCHVKRGVPQTLYIWSACQCPREDETLGSDQPVCVPLWGLYSTAHCSRGDLTNPFSLTNYGVVASMHGGSNCISHWKGFLSTTTSLRPQFSLISASSPVIFPQRWQNFHAYEVVPSLPNLYSSGFKTWIV